jgi:hypothetical protein
VHVDVWVEMDGGTQHQSIVATEVEVPVNNTLKPCTHVENALNLLLSEPLESVVCWAWCYAWVAHLAIDRLKLGSSS